jgi:Icc protein
VKTQSWTLVQISDSHLFSDSKKTLCGLRTYDSLTQVLSAVRKSKISASAILATGDLSQDGSPASYRLFLKRMKVLDRPVFALPGNHDNPSVMARILKKGPVQAVKIVVLGNWTIFFLDSTLLGRNEGRFKPRELAQLKRYLSINPNPHTLICFHHNTLPTKSRWLDTMTIQNAKDFYRIVDRHKTIRAIVYGHIHQSFEKTRKGVRHLGAPSTCLQFQPKSKTMNLDKAAPGFRWIRLYSNGKIQTAVVRVKNYQLKPDYKATRY